LLCYPFISKPDIQLPGMSGAQRNLDRKIVVIGAGASGVACATKLLELGFQNVLVVEAEDRLGGRIHTIPFADNVIDLGAQWCHGERDNIVYELTRKQDEELLESTGPVTKPAASICVGGSWARTAERRLNGPPPSCVTRYGASSGISRTSRTLSISFCKDHWKINLLPGTQHYRIELSVLLQQKDFEIPFKIAKYAIYSWFNSLFSVVSIINCTELFFLALYM